MDRNRMMKPSTQSAALRRYMSALEHGNLETVAAIVQLAETDPTLERMLLAVNDAYLDQQYSTADNEESQRPANQTVQPERVALLRTKQIYGGQEVPSTKQLRMPKPRWLGTFAAVLSVVALLGGFFALFSAHGISTIAYGERTPAAATQQPYSTANVPMTPVATAGPQGKYVTGCVTAEGHDINGVALKLTSHFQVNHQVWVLCSASNFSKGSHVFTIHWFLDNVNVAVPTQNSTVTTDKAQILEFSYVFGQPGLGTAQVFMDLPSSDPGTQANDPYLAATIYFAIDPIGSSTVPPNTPTVTPSPSPKATSTP